MAVPFAKFGCDQSSAFSKDRQFLKLFSSFSLTSLLVLSLNIFESPFMLYLVEIDLGVIEEIFNIWKVFDNDDHNNDGRQWTNFPQKTLLQAN